MTRHLGLYFYKIWQGRYGERLCNWDEWNKIAESMTSHKDQKVKIAMVGNMSHWQIAMLVLTMH